MKIRPLNDRVIVKRLEEERTSPGGIVIASVANDEGAKSREALDELLEDGKAK